MPNRIIRDGWVESESVNSLSAHAERFFIRLCLRADDYGRYHGDLRLLRSNLFPLHDTISVAMIKDWLEECVRVGVIKLYQIERKSFILIPKFNQRKGRNASKFPPMAVNGPSIDRQLTVNGQSIACESLSEAEAKAETKTEACAQSVCKRVESMKAKFAEWYKRKPTLQWDHIEEGLMVEISKRPDFDDEWLAIVSYRKDISDPKYFPSGQSLLENWQKTLDKAKAAESTKTEEPDDFDNWKPV